MRLFASTIFNRPALAFLYTFALLLYGFYWSFRPFLFGRSSQAETAIVYSGHHYSIMPVGDHGYSTVTHEYTRDQLFSLRQPRVIDRAALRESVILAYNYGHLNVGSATGRDGVVAEPECNVAS